MNIASQINTKFNIIRLPELLQIVGLSRPSIYRLVKLGEFPQQVKIGLSAVGWSRTEVEHWIAGRMNARQTTGAGELKHAA